MQIWNDRMSDRSYTQMHIGGPMWAERPVGVFASTRVATGFGWRQISDIAEGDLVLTFDAGMQPVAHVRQFELGSEMAATDPSQWPLFVPAGALGNLSDVIVMPGQSVLVESALAERLMGQRFVLIRAADLDSVAGIFRVAPSDRTMVTSLSFADDQIMFGAGGALFFCEGPGDLTASRARGMYHHYRELTSAEADLVLSQEIIPAGVGMADAAGRVLT